MVKLSKHQRWGSGATNRGRRQVLNRLANPTTQQFLLHSGLKPGMKVLDLTCGLGIMSSWIAQVVGPTGSVLALDSCVEQLIIAEELAKEQGISNISFKQLAVEEIAGLANDFDFAYSRFLLIHLVDPLDLLKTIYSKLKPGGIFACESAILGNEFCYPEFPAFERWRELNRSIFVAMDRDPQTGKKLYNMMTQVGFHGMSGRLFQPILTSKEEREEMIVNDLMAQEDALIEYGLASELEIEELGQELHELIDNDAYFIGYCQSCQVAGVK